MIPIPGLAEISLGMKVIGFFKKVPSWVWIALAVVAVIGAGLIYHGHKVKAFGDERYQAGVDAEAARIEAKARALAAKAAAITAKIRSQNDETNRRISSDADDLRLRGAGKASCLAPSAPGASGHGSANRPGDAPVGQVPDPERVDIIGLPFADTIAFAEQHDRFRAAALWWREQHDKLSAAAPPVQP